MPPLALRQVQYERGLECCKDLIHTSHDFCGLLEHQVHVFMLSHPAEIRPQGNDRFPPCESIPHLPCGPGICIRTVDDGNDNVSVL